MTAIRKPWCALPVLLVIAAIGCEARRPPSRTVKKVSLRLPQTQGLPTRGRRKGASRYSTSIESMDTAKTNPGQ
jgi:hypothetical protein